MLQILKEMNTMSDNLVKLIVETNNPDERVQLFKKYQEVSNQIEEISKKVFGENDKFYRETIEKIKNTEQLFADFMKNQEKLTNVFNTLTTIITNVEKILLGWKPAKKK